ncbi:hypothetical protein [Sodalis-like endosymbiont of Proechinophthirus fluctus]|uniref:hypothetical protein n=1 Tax=Sodalis-like endosymbiont of Proechinophthirus fluctus TaxID=1462730 RepID=UPI000A52FF48|nr:hypothetical protein [Sodalis-like endosymbiont of Proechinophthirus fluctus]
MISCPEAYLGVQLIKRTTCVFLSPTEVRQLYYHCIKILLNELDDALDDSVRRAADAASGLSTTDFIHFFQRLAAGAGAGICGFLPLI